MKIVHISDLHINTEFKRENNEKANRILEYIVDSGFDHLIISGDITENADRNSMEYARKLLKKFNLLDADKLTVVIGNHDIFGGVNYAEDVIQFPKKCKNISYEDKVSQFEYYFRESFNNTFQPDKNNIFPFAKELGGILLVGINTIANYSLFNNPFASNGLVNKEQFNNIEKILNSNAFSNKTKIVIAHHHFIKNHNDCSVDSSIWKRIEKQTMKLRNKRKLLKLFSTYDVKTVLHGHLHESNEYNRKGINFFNAGGATLGYKSELKINYINIISNEASFEMKSIPSCSMVEKSSHQISKYKHTPKLIKAEICLN